MEYILDYIPQCPPGFGSLATVHELLTVVGGCHTSDLKATNKLVSFNKRELR